MKTTYPTEDLSRFIHSKIPSFHGTIEQLSEGHSSQAVCFETEDGLRLVLRVRNDENALLADKYAYEHFSSNIPIPKAIDTGIFPLGGYYIISSFSPGQTANKLDSALFDNVLPLIQDLLSNIFHTDISNTKGYGYIDVSTGNASADSWKQSLLDELKELNIEALKEHAQILGIDIDIIDKLLFDFNSHLKYASEKRRLLHGDPGSDNLTINNGQVSAIFDWEQMSYGDWARDFARFGYYKTSDYGNIRTFGQKYGLETEYLDKRVKLYQAIYALRDIEFASSQHNEKLTRFIKAKLAEII